MFEKDRAIIAQNSATAAATLLAGKPFDQAEYERVRTAIFEGSLALANGGGTVQRVQEAFVGSTVVEPEAQPAPAPRPTNQNDPATLVLKFGKHRDKTIGQVDAEGDRSWLEWAAENSSNEFVAKRIAAYLASTPAAA